jgi:hypothetical protein
MHGIEAMQKNVIYTGFGGGADYNFTETVSAGVNINARLGSDMTDFFGGLGFKVKLY